MKLKYVIWPGKHCELFADRSLLCLRWALGLPPGCPKVQGRMTARASKGGGGVEEEEEGEEELAILMLALDQLHRYKRLKTQAIITFS